MPFFVHAAFFRSPLLEGSCYSRPKRRARACAFPILAFLLLFLFLLCLHSTAPVQRDRQQSERRSPRTKRFSIHPKLLCSHTTSWFDVTVPGWSDRAQARRGFCSSACWP